jgi:hypothetical protein
MKRSILILMLLLFATCFAGQQSSNHEPMFQPFTWKSEPPADCPFDSSSEITGIEFLGVHSDYRFADTWYPSWAADGNLYSPWTDGGNTCARMNTFVLEAPALPGPWRLATYMKNFGEQAYFVNLPSKFISPDGRTAWLCYSGNFAPDWNGEKIKANPPGTRYGLVLQKIRLLGPAAR